MFPSLLLIPLLIATSIFAAQTPFQSGTPDEIVTYIDSLVKNNVTTKPIMTSLIQELQESDNDIRVRERAAWALGALGVKRATPALIEAAKHKGLLIRSAALGALSRLRDRSALPVFEEIATNDPILSLRQRATVALGLLQWDKTIPKLVELSSDQTPDVQGAAALAMAATQSKKADFTQALLEMAGEGEPYVKRRAEAALKVVKRDSAAVRKQLDSEDEDIRLFAALYFTNHGTSKDIAKLKDSLNGDASDDVRYELTRAVASIKKRAAEAKARKERQAREAAKKAAAEAKPAAPSN